jgi:hypothetical protein
VSIANDWWVHFFILKATGTAPAFDGVRLNNGSSDAIELRPWEARVYRRVVR